MSAIINYTNVANSNRNRRKSNQDQHQSISSTSVVALQPTYLSISKKLHFVASITTSTTDNGSQKQVRNIVQQLYNLCINQRSLQEYLFVFLLFSDCNNFRTINTNNIRRRRSFVRTGPPLPSSSLLLHVQRVIVTSLILYYLCTTACSATSVNTNTRNNTDIDTTRTNYNILSTMNIENTIVRQQDTDYRRQTETQSETVDEAFVNLGDDEDHDENNWNMDDIEEIHLRKLVTIFDRKQQLQQQQQQQEQPRIGTRFALLRNIKSTTWIVRLSDTDTTKNDEILRNTNVAAYIKGRTKLLMNVIIVKGISRTTIRWLLQQSNILLIEENQPVYGVDQSINHLDDTVLIQQKQLRNARKESVILSPSISPRYESPKRTLQKGDKIPSKVTVNLKDGQPWGIDMSDGTFDRKYTYTYSGVGVKVYVFDTGVSTIHDEFSGGRSVCGINTIDEEICEDLKGHGTHVAGIIGGKTYGIARSVQIINVKVLNQNATGNVAFILEGLEYVVAQKLASPDTPMIINLSVGSNYSTTFNDAVDKCVANGIHAVIAAGNTNSDACTTSPSSADKGISVGGTTPLYFRGEWSNYGPCVDLFAPGLAILSSIYDPKDTKKTGYRTGTSMSAPHVAGVMALYLQWNPTLTPDQLEWFLRNDGLVDVLFGTDGSDNGSDDVNNNILVSSAKVQTYFPVTRAPSMVPSMVPSSSPDLGENGPTCGTIFTRCIVDEDCCNKCLNINLFNLGLWGSRCFIFG